MIDKLKKLIDVKSIVTLLFSATLVALLFTEVKPDAEFKTLFCSTFSAIITYFFTKKVDDKQDK